MRVKAKVLGVGATALIATAVAGLAIRSLVVRLTNKVTGGGGPDILRLIWCDQLIQWEEVKFS